MKFIKKNLTAVSGLFVTGFFIFLAYSKPASGMGNYVSIFIGVFLITFVLLWLIYFRDFRKTE